MLYCWLRDLYFRLIKLPIALLISKLIFRDNEMNYIVVCDHIGDLLITVSYIKAYKHSNNINRLTVCVTERFCPLLEESNEFEIKVLKRKTIQTLSVLCATQSGIKYLEKHKMIIVNPADSFVEDYYEYPARFPNVHFEDLIKYGILQLNESDQSDYSFLNIPDRLDTNSKEKTVVLFPDAQVTQLADHDLFLRLAKHFSEQGFKVLINSAGAVSDKYHGYALFSGGLREIASLAGTCSCFIGVRSGVMDLVNQFDIRMIVVYPNDDQYKRFYRIQKGRAKVMEVTESMLDIDTVIRFAGGVE